MNHTTTAQPITAADEEITSTIEEWEQRTSRSDERDERPTSAGLNSASLIDMFGSVA
jgi:hypothetical protein